MLIISFVFIILTEGPQEGSDRGLMLSSLRYFMGEMEG